MGRDLAEAFQTARLVFEEVDDALGQRLSRLMFEGPESDLTLTENAQPALMAVSLAVTRVIERDGGTPLFELGDFVAGHSLGEYSALAAAGSLELGDAARLLRQRGQAMQKAVPVGAGAMAAILGLDLESVRDVAQEASQAGEIQAGEICVAANDNAPGQVVISGDKAAVERAVALSAERGGKRSVMLPVSAPFHCPLMAPAADVMAEALAAVTLAPPQVPLIANVTARPLQDPETLRRLLVEQVTGLVRWRESVEFMRDESVELLVECGAGKVLTGLARRIDRQLSAQSLSGPADIESFLGSL